MLGGFQEFITVSSPPQLIERFDDDFQFIDPGVGGGPPDRPPHPGIDDPELGPVIDCGLCEIVCEHDVLLGDIRDCVNAALCMVRAGADVINNCATTGMMTLLLNPQNFLAEYQSIISAEMDCQVISGCEMVNAIVMFADEALLSQSLSDEEFQIISAIRRQFARKSELANCDLGSAIYDSAAGGVVIPCDEEHCPDDDPIGHEEDDEPCEPDSTIEVCGLDTLTAQLERIADCVCPKEGENGDNGERRLVAWYNCETRETRLLPIRALPPEPLNDWEKVGGFQETIDALMECLCDIADAAEGNEEQPPPEDIIRGLLGLGFNHQPECLLPPFLAFSPEVLGLLGKFLVGAIAAGTIAGIVGVLPGVNIPTPSMMLLFFLVLLLHALLIVLKHMVDDPCINGPAAIALTSRIWYTFWERIIPGCYAESIVASTQVFNFYCPKEIPDMASAHQAFLSNDIDIEKWRCWVRANGQHDVMAIEVLKSQRSKLNPGELVSLLNRGEILGVDFNRRIRELGFLDQAEPREFQKLSEQFPGQSDLIHFMVRDTEDKTIVDRFKLKDKFDKKFKGDIKKWAEWANVPEEVMLKNWIAHWRYPGYRQLTEAMHRFRNEPANSPIRTTEDDIRVALEADDLPEFWVKRMIAMSFLPLTRVDARRAFNIGSINEQELKKSFDDLGYSDESTKALVRFTKDQKQKRYLRHPATKALSTGSVTDVDFDAWMKEDGASPDDIVKSRDRAELLQRVKTQSVCVRALHKRFLVGEMSSNNAFLELRMIGVPNDIALQLQSAWECEIKAKGKNASLTQLCQWLENGTMDVTEFQTRLHNLGWDTIEANRIIKVCSDRIQLKITKIEQAAMRRQITEAEKARKEGEKAEKAREAAEKQRERQADKAAKSRLSRDKVLAAAAEKFGKRVGLPLADTFAEMKALFNRLTQLQAGRQDVIAAAIKESTDDPELTTMRQIADAVVQILTPAESFAD